MHMPFKSLLTISRFSLCFIGMISVELGCGGQQLDCPAPYNRAAVPPNGIIEGGVTLYAVGNLEDPDNIAIYPFTMGAVVFDENTGQPLGLTTFSAFHSFTFDGFINRKASLVYDTPRIDQAVPFIGEYRRGDYTTRPRPGTAIVDYSVFTLENKNTRYETSIYPEIRISSIAPRAPMQLVSSASSTRSGSYLPGSGMRSVPQDLDAILLPPGGTPNAMLAGAISYISAGGQNQAVGLILDSATAGGLAYDQELRYIIDKSVNPRALGVRLYDSTLNPVAFFRYIDDRDGAQAYTTDWSQFTSGGNLAGTLRNYVFQNRREGAMFRSSITYNGITMIPVRWFYNPRVNDSIYTTSAAENAALAAPGSGWCDMDVVGYVPPQDANLPGTIPLYRWRNPQNQKHLFTTNFSEVSVASGWEPEGNEVVFSHDGEPDPNAFNDAPKAIYQISETCSNANFEVNGQVYSVPISGTVSLSIEPGCTSTVCGLTISNINLHASNASIGGHSVGDIRVTNNRLLVGSWDNSGHYSLPVQGMTLTTTFTLDSTPSTLTVTNMNNPAQGELDSLYTRFTLAGNFANGNSTLSLGLCGLPLGRPPSASFSPLGPFECSSPTGTDVEFSSASSFDPDNDIQRRVWRIDNLVSGVDVVNMRSRLSLGLHPVSLTVFDSRQASDTYMRYANVADTTPPSIQLSTTHQCIFPPNHKYVLYTLGKDLLASLNDSCDSSPKAKIVSVKSNQPATDVGSGNTSPDIRFTEQSVCLRAERTGTAPTPREYTVTVQAADTHGNTTTADIIISVPHNADLQKDCNIPKEMVVEDSDPRCATGTPGL